MSENGCDSGLVIARNNYRRAAGLKKRQFGCYISNTSPAEGQETAFNAVDRFTDGFINGENQTGLLLVGGVGSGKTFLVSSAANSIIDTIEVDRCEKEKEIGRGFSFWCMVCDRRILFINVCDLMEQLKSCFKENSADISSNIIQVVQEVDLLILDDLGVEKSSDWTREKLFEVIDYRYSQELPMLVTTNCRPEELKEKIGDRNFDRLREMCALVTVTAKSQRPTATL